MTDLYLKMPWVVFDLLETVSTQRMHWSPSRIIPPDAER